MHLRAHLTFPHCFDIIFNTGVQKATADLGTLVKTVQGYETSLQREVRLLHAPFARTDLSQKKDILSKTLEVKSCVIKCISELRNLHKALTCALIPNAVLDRS